MKFSPGSLALSTIQRIGSSGTGLKSAPLTRQLGDHPETPTTRRYSRFTLNSGSPRKLSVPSRSARVRNSIWHGTADSRVVLRNWRELVEQWSAVHGIPAKPARSERNGSVTRELHTDAVDAVRHWCVSRSANSEPSRWISSTPGHDHQLVDDVIGYCCAQGPTQGWP